MKQLSLFFIWVILVQSGYSKEKKKDPADYINPFIGATTNNELGGSEHGLGKTFPGAATPFGMIQLSPDTRTGGDNGPGYSWHHPTIEGFSFMHMSGIGWFGEFGNFLVMPTTGELKTAKGKEETPESGYRSRFSHDTETAKAGYYAVTLSDYNIRTELTAAPKAGIIRFTYPENKLSRIQIDLSRRIGGTSTKQFVEIVDNNTIRGWMKCPPEGGGWGNGAGNCDYIAYFYCQFSKPLTNSGVWNVDILDDWSRLREDVTSDKYQQLVANAKVERGIKSREGKHLGFFLEFETKANEQVLLKCGISFVSMDGARKNLEHDIPDWNFDKTEKQAHQLWLDTFKTINVEGGTERDKTVFATAIYHSFIDPRIVNDVDGNYIGIDKQVHNVSELPYQYRTIFSGWDVFRSQFPLMTIISPELVNDEINSLIQMADVSGRSYFPRWEIMNSYSGCMIGNPAVSVLVDAWQKGIRDYDIDKAYQFAKNSVDMFGNGEKGYTAASSSNGKIKSLSHTLEYAYTDWCVGELASLLGKDKDAKIYNDKGQNYKNVWNEDVKWFRGREEDGSWMKWRGKLKQNQGTVESNPYQQGWFVPHDVKGLQKLMGPEYFEKQLTTFFDSVPDNFLWNDYYNHANEPVHHVAYLFNEIGKPWLTQKWTRRICEEAYGPDVLGLVGNEDVGQMSAWYILSSIGIHPVSPGDGKYQITSPVFDKVVIDLDNKYYKGRTFTVVAKNNSKENVYIQSAKLDGQPLKRSWISHQEIANGGILEFEMGPEPNMSWGIESN